MKIIADCCNNHEGKMTKIKEMIDQLIDLGIDYAKFQVYTADKLNPNYPDYENAKKSYKDCELSQQMIQYIIEYCKDIKPLFTIFDIDKVDMLYNLGMRIIKIASPDMMNYPLIYKCLEKFEIVIISTGMHTLTEFEKVAQMYKGHVSGLVFLYCKSQYPAIYNKIDLAKEHAIRIFCNTLGCGYGISDHSENVDIPLGDWYEHHFTLEKTGKKDDWVSWTAEEFQNHILLGDEYENRLKYKTRWL